MSVMRFLHLGLVLSLVLTTKASDDPNHADSVSENPTGRAAVHGHPKVAAGSSGYRHAPPPYPYKPPKYNSEPHYHDTYKDSNDLPDYYEEDYHSSEKDDYHHGAGHKAPTQDLVSLHTLKDVLADLLEDFLYEVKSYKCPKYVPEDKCDPDKWVKVLHELVEEAVNKIVEKKAHDREAISRDPHLIGLLAAALAPTLLPGIVNAVTQPFRPPPQTHSRFSRSITTDQR